MHQNQQTGSYSTKQQPATISLNHHASLLLSQSPTIIYNNSSTSSSSASSQTTNNSISININARNINNPNLNNNLANNLRSPHSRRSNPNLINNITNMNSNASSNIIPTSPRTSLTSAIVVGGGGVGGGGGSQQQQIQRDQLNAQQQNILLQPQTTNNQSIVSRRHPSLLGPLSASSQQLSANSDNNLSANLDSRSNADSPHSIETASEGFVDFEKPTQPRPHQTQQQQQQQDDLLKKLDGKIQKLVAAHSNFNKLYALNDFSGLNAGTKRPFELPPKLPPPPPWVPKGSSTEFNSVSQWAQDSFGSDARLELPEFRPCSSNSSSSIQEMNHNPAATSSGSLPMSNHLRNTPIMSTPKTNNKGNLLKTASLTIDSAISRLHQRRLQQQLQQQPPQPTHQQPRQLPQQQQQQLSQQQKLQFLQQIRQRERQNQMLIQRQQRQQLLQQHRLKQQQIQQQQQVAAKQQLLGANAAQRRLVSRPINQQVNLARRSDTQHVGSAQLYDSFGSRPVSVRNLLHSSNPGMSGDNAGMDSPQTASNKNTPTITSAQFNLLAQKIKETLETECANKNQAGTLSPEDKKKFQENLIALLKQEITAVAKSVNLKFNSPPTNQPKPSDRNSLILKSSPQTLFNTIRRETSLLLSRREKVNRFSDNANKHSDETDSSSAQLRDSRQRQSTNLIYRQSLQPRSHENLTLLSPIKLPLNKLQQTVKVVIPPTELYQNPSAQTKLSNEKKEESENLYTNVGSRVLKDGTTASLRRSSLTYQVIRSKLKAFQDNNQIYLGKSVATNLFSLNSLNSSGKLFQNKKLAQRSLDKIVDRLQARCSGTISDQDPQRPDSISLQQRIINSSAELLRVAAAGRRPTPTASSPTSIPVFRSSLAVTSMYHDSRVLKSKKSKRHHNFGLKIANYNERECPQSSNERLSIDQYAKCLNLVRANDIAVRRHREQLESEVKWRLPVSNRPLRLRRIRGERLPPSASYKATRKAGLQ